MQRLGGDSFAYDQVKGLVRYAGVVSMAPAAGNALAGVPVYEEHTAVISVRLVSIGNGSSVDLVIDRESHAKFADSPNAAAFGRYLHDSLKTQYDKSGDATGALMRELDALIDGAQVTAALRAANPGGAYASMYTASARRAMAFGASLEGRLDQLAGVGAKDAVFNLGVKMHNDKVVLPPMMTPHQDPTHEWAAWTTGYANRSVFAADAGAGFARASSRDSGSMLGVERIFGNLRAGVLAGFGQDDASFEDPSLTVSGDQWTAGGYGVITIGAISLDASLLWSRSEERSTRATAKADFATQTTQLGLGVACNLLPSASGWQLTPIARLLAIGYKQDAFEESGSGLLYRSAKVSEGAVFSKLGLRIGHLSKVSRNLTLGVDGTASWVHDFAATGKAISMQAVGTNGWFQNTGRQNEADMAQFNVGIQGTFMENVTLRVSGQRDVGNARSQSSGQLSIAIDF